MTRHLIASQLIPWLTVALSGKFCHFVALVPPVQLRIKRQAAVFLGRRLFRIGLPLTSNLLMALCEFLLRSDSRLRHRNYKRSTTGSTCRVLQFRFFLAHNSDTFSASDLTTWPLSGPSWNASAFSMCNSQRFRETAVAYKRTVIHLIN